MRRTVDLPRKYIDTDRRSTQEVRIT